MQTLCHHLKVSRSGYYEWRDRQPSHRSVANRVMTERIREIHRWSDGTYGMPRIHTELREMGERVSRNRVARLMRLAHLRGVSRRRGYVVTTRRDTADAVAPDLVKRQFVATGIIAIPKINQT